MIEVHAEFPQREVIQANAVVDNEEKTVSEVIISAKPEITGVTASVDNETGTPYVDVTETGTGTDFSFNLAFHNLKGDKGEQGETGQTGNGIVSITKTATVGLEDDYTISFTNGTQTVFTVTNGADGQDGTDGTDGQDGQDGFSPIATVEPIQDGAKITITDKDGTTTTNVYNGTDGQDGADGQAATVTVGTTTTGAAGTNASVVNSGTSSAAVFDFVIPRGDKGDTGNTGATGQDGFSPSASVSQSGGVTTISITDKNGTTTESIDLSSYATQTDLTNGLATKQDTISDLSTIRSNAANGQSAYTTIGGYGDIVTYNASNFVQKNGDSSTQTISLTSGTGTTALGIKSMATSSYISLSGSSGWLGSYGVSSSKRAVFYNGTGYTLAYTSEIPTNTSELTNDSGYITGIDSSDVITALGYTPYDSTNPNGYTSNVGTVTSVNNTQPDANGNVTLAIPTVNDGILTITQNGTSKGTFSANQSTNDTIALTDTTYNAFTGADGTNAGSSGLVPAPSATDNDKYLKGDGTWANVSSGSSTDVQINGTSITNQGVANIVTNSAYDASSNKIATMSDLPDSEIFIATYGTTTFQQISDAFNANKAIFCKRDDNYKTMAVLKDYGTTNFTFFGCQPDGSVRFMVNSSNTWTSNTYTCLTSSSTQVASSRFDGQWVAANNAQLLNSGSSGTVDCTSTLKTIMGSYANDGYKYEILLSTYVVYGSSGADLYVSSSIISQIGLACATSNGRYARSCVIIPVDSTRTISFKKSATFGTCRIDVVGFRRIGTNS